MIDYIQGKVVYKSQNKVVIDKDGFGLSIETPSNLNLEGKIKLYTYLSLKDEEIRLYGFDSRESRDLFLKLISISGIGIKHAMELLSTFKPFELVEAIENRDVTLLSTVKGIGKKTAQRIIFELQGKLDFYDSEIMEDLVEALQSLGYSKKEAMKVAVEVIKETKDIEQAIKIALQKLSEK